MLTTSDYATAAKGAMNSVTANKVPTFAGAVEYADDRVRVLVNRLSALADRLVGSAPQDPSAEGLASVPAGVFDEVLRRANSIATSADLGMDLINRIERSLP